MSQQPELIKQILIWGYMGFAITLSGYFIFISIALFRAHKDDEDKLTQSMIWLTLSHAISHFWEFLIVMTIPLPNEYIIIRLAIAFFQTLAIGVFLWHLKLRMLVKQAFQAIIKNGK